MRMTAYCKIDYLKSLTANNRIDYMDENYTVVAQSKLNLLDFLLTGAVVKTDLSPDEIAHQFDNPFIKSLMKSGRLISAKNQFDSFKNDINLGFINAKIDLSTIFLFDGISIEQSTQLEEFHGYHFIGDQNTLSNLFELKIQSFQRNQITNWQFAKSFLKPHNAIVIVDPYLFKVATLSSILNIIKSVASSKLKGEYFISLIGSNKRRGLNDDDAFIKKQIEKLKAEIQNSLPGVKLKLEYHFCNNEDFHDRYIITNNICIFSGYGFDIIKNDKCIKETTWLAYKPYKRLEADGKTGVFFYKIMQDKLKQIRKWIDKGDKGDQGQPINPLLNFD